MCNHVHEAVVWIVPDSRGMKLLGVLQSMTSHLPDSYIGHCICTGVYF